MRINCLTQGHNCRDWFWNQGPLLWNSIDSSTQRGQPHIVIIWNKEGVKSNRWNPVTELVLVYRCMEEDLVYTQQQKTVCYKNSLLIRVPQSLHVKLKFILCKFSYSLSAKFWNLLLFQGNVCRYSLACLFVYFNSIKYNKRAKQILEQ